LDKDAAEVKRHMPSESPQGRRIQCQAGNLPSFLPEARAMGDKSLKNNDKAKKQKKVKKAAAAAK
jgi:hypothetical protein